MNRLLYNRAIVNKLSELIEKYPEQRFGQLLIDCDVIQTKFIDCGYILLDPFYEEPEKTWNRMINNKFCFNENIRSNT